MVKRVRGFQTGEGEFFSSKRDAEKAAAIEVFKEWYYKKDIHGNGINALRSVERVPSWLINSKEEVLAFYEAYDASKKREEPIPDHLQLKVVTRSHCHEEKHRNNMYVPDSKNPICHTCYNGEMV